jgi:hemoglobin/transferrin/lactoferrin receptor protein
MYKTLTIALLAALPEVGSAEGPEPSQRSIELDAVTVVGTKTERTLANTPGTITLKSRTQLERELARDIKDAVRYEPGVSVTNQASRFGLAGFTVRGLDGNRVLIEIDGARVADGFSIGSFSSAGRDAVELDVLKRLEIVRGSASSLYGSSAMGGVVAFTTQGPLDYLTADHNFAGQLRSGFSSEDQSRSISSTTAFGGPENGLLLSLSQRRFNEAETTGNLSLEGSARDAANPQEQERRALMAKYVGQLAEGHRVSVTLDGSRGETQTNVLSARGRQVLGPTVINVTDLRGDDQTRRTRTALDYQYQPQNTLLDGLHLKLYTQRSETQQDTSEQRSTTSRGVTTPAVRTRRFLFEQDLSGLDLRSTTETQLQSTSQRWTLGLTHLQTDTMQLRDGSTFNPITGVRSNVVGPDVFPVRDFPESTTREQSLYVQAELNFGALTLIPGVRYDRYQLTPRTDAIFSADNPGIDATQLSEDAFSPKLGALYALSDSFSLNLNIATGFRAPPVNDVNIGFTNLQFGYTAIPNAALKSESSRGLEFGIRARAPLGFLDLTAYRNHYDDFIDSLSFVRSDPVTGISIFQSRNVREVSIRGVELRGQLFFGELSPALEGYGLRMAAAHSHGDDRFDDIPLNSIDPQKLVIGLNYEAERWRLELVGSAVRRKGRLDERSGPLFRTPGYGLLDLIAEVRLPAEISLQMGVFNLLDRTVLDWSDVRGRPANDPGILRFARPGRNFSVALNYRF